MAEVLIEGRRLDVMKGLDFSFNYSVADIREPAKRNTEYSKTIKCPGTKSNDVLFGQIYDVNISNPYDVNSINIETNFNPNKKAEARVISDGVEVMAGTVQLRKIVMQGTDYVYEVVFIGRLINIFAKLADKQLNGVDDNGNYYIDLSDLDHVYNRPNQITSWTTPAGQGYTYPMLDFGRSFKFTGAGRRVYSVTDFNPAIYAKDLIDRIFTFAGFTYTCDLFVSGFFKRLIIPISKLMNLPNDQADARSFKVVKSVPQILHRLSTIDPNTYGNEQHFVNSGVMAKLCFDDDTTLGFDNNNQFRILSSPGNLFNFNAVNNYMFYCQQPQRNDTFRASVDLYLKINADVGPDVYEGTLELIHWENEPNSYRVAYSTSWSFNLNQPVGTVLTQTVYVEGDIETVAADQVYVRMNSEPQANGYKSEFKDLTGGLHKIEFQAVGGYFENDPVQEHLYEGDMVTLSDHLPEVEMTDVLMSIFNMFNLYITPDPLNELNLIIETRDDFYDAGSTKDWTKKLARDKPIELEPLALLTAREYIYTYSEDGDYYNERYYNNYRRVYGSRRVEVDNDFLTNTQEISVVFSATPLVNDNPSNRIIGKIYDSDIEEGATPTDSNIRILYYAGLLTSDPSWRHRNTTDDLDTYSYPYAGHLTHPLAPSQDINFGIPNELYYSANSFTGTLLYTNNNLFNQFHRKQVDEITDKDSKIMTAHFYLTAWDIEKLDFRDQILIDNAYWRLNKVTNYNPFKEGLTKVELLKIKEVAKLETEAFAIGNSGTVSNETKPITGRKSMVNNNRYPPFQGTVKGRGNNIGDSANDFKVIGDNNFIGEGSTRVTILGNNNTVRAGLNDVVIINSNGVDVTESNVTYNGNVKSYAVRIVNGGEDTVIPSDAGTIIRWVDGGVDIVQVLNGGFETNYINGEIN